MFIDLQCPIRSAIFIYLLLIVIIFVAKPTLINPEYRIFLGPTAVFLAVVVYFLMTVMSLCF